MSAELLRRAATLMRERAEAATQTRYRNDRGRLVPVDAPRGHTLAGAERSNGILRTIEDAEHFASWHPAAALAVSAWLEGVAERHYEDGVEELLLHPEEPCSVCAEQGGHEMPVCGGCYPTWDAEHARAVWPCVEFLDALAVARAYLGEEGAWTG